MKMNGMDYVDTQLVQQPIQDFYEMLRNEPGLAWLSRNYRNQNGVDPEQEWHAVRDKVQSISRWEKIVPMIILVTSIMPAILTICVFEYNHCENQLIQSLVSIPIFLASFSGAMTMNNRLAVVWNELTKGWLKATWTTREFTDETWNLCIALGNDRGFSLRSIREALAARTGDRQGEVPLHVVHMANEAVDGKVRRVVNQKEDGVASACVSFGDNGRREARNVLELFQSFRILPSDRTVGHYYRRVEQQTNPGK